MSFYGTSFSFDGISCEEFGLMLYDLDSTTQGASSWATGTKIKEERIPGRMRSIYYGKTEESNLEFTLVFGANEYAARAGEPIDRAEMQVISLWLTGPDDYRYLQIDQPDMAGVRYRCIITDLKMVELFGKKCGFTCKVHCDSPYAYTLPITYSYSADNSVAEYFELNDYSTVSGLYYPKVTVQYRGLNAFAIDNKTTGTQTKFNNLPQTSGTITMDGERGIITDSNNLNVYPYFNFVFLPLQRGTNDLILSAPNEDGNLFVTIECEFPMNVGG